MNYEIFKKLGWSLIIGSIVGLTLFITFGTGNMKWAFISEQLLNSLSILFSVLIALGITFISIYYSSGKWYKVYERFTILGIEDAQRKGKAEK